MLFVCTWLWGNKWDAVYPRRLFAGVRTHLKMDHRSVLITDRPIFGAADITRTIDHRDGALLAKPGCLARMRLFDRGMQERIGMNRGDRMVNVDLDAVITGPLDPLFDIKDEFRIMQGFNSTNPCPFNGSLWTARAGERHDVWEDFSWPEVLKIPRHHIPDDQGWLHHKFPNAAAYTPKDGVYAFKKKTWPGGRDLPKDARVVTFPGRDPAKYAAVDWVNRHWLKVAA